MHPRIVQLTALALLPLALWTIKDKKTIQEAYIKWAEEKVYFNMNIFEETTDHYRELYPLLKKEPVFLFEYGQCLSKTGQYEESIRILREGTCLSSDPMFYNIIGKNHQALKQYESAEKAFRQASLMIPHRLYPDYLMAKMYFESRQIPKGVEAAKKLINKEPKVMSEAVEEMKKEMSELIKNNSSEQ